MSEVIAICGQLQNQRLGSSLMKKEQVMLMSVSAPRMQNLPAATFGVQRASL